MPHFELRPQDGDPDTQVEVISLQRATLSRWKRSSWKHSGGNLCSFKTQERLDVAIMLNWYLSILYIMFCWCFMIDVAMIALGWFLYDNWLIFSWSAVDLNRIESRSFSSQSLRQVEGVCDGWYHQLVFTCYTTLLWFTSYLFRNILYVFATILIVIVITTVVTIDVITTTYYNFCIE